MPSTRCLLIIVGISLCAAVLTGCEQPPPTVGQVWLVDETYTPVDATIRAQMNEIVPKVQFDGVSFEIVVKSLQETGKVNIHVRWSALEAVGVDKDTWVGVDLTNVTFAKALRVILDDVGGVNPLDYIIDGSVITISHCDDLSRYTVTRIYDVSDLINRPKPASWEKAMLHRLLREAVHQPIRIVQESEDSGSSDFSPWDDDDDLETLAEAYRGRISDLAEAVEEGFQNRRLGELIDIIRTTVVPMSWLEMSGETGSIFAFDGKLIITQTRKAHHRIERLLSALRGKSPVISSDVLPVQLQAHRLIPPSPEEILARTPVMVPPEKWPAGNKKAIVESVKILGTDTSRIYVVFLVDCTGSMLESLDNAINEQIIPAMKNLSGEQYFNVICFQGKSTLDPFRGKLVPATADNKRKVTMFLRERVLPEGQSPFLPA
ncbi:MAG: hypothetical protein KAV00_16080, partial [Phycisphaerae bacterium]|nr:hypothetical protein [Phycisphaerae bacterium]